MSAAHLRMPAPLGMGLFEAAQGGTLFLDELPSLSLGLQAKVLTVIEDHKLRRVGGNKAIPVDARIIAATQRDLKEMVSQGQFREDLYHRLDLFRVSIPPLRDRGEDIVELAEWMLQSLCRKHSLPQKAFTAAGRERLLAYHWPGNVRELAPRTGTRPGFRGNGRTQFCASAGKPPHASAIR